MVLADDWLLSTREFQVPGVPGVVTAAHDERGEVGVVVVREEAQRACWRPDADLHESRAAALIALTGGLDGHRRDVSCWGSVTAAESGSRALPCAGCSFDSVGGGQVQVAHDVRRPCAAGLRASQGTARGSNEPLAAALMRASIAVCPLRDGTSCKGMPWPLNRDEIHHHPP